MVESILCLLSGLGIFVASITLFSQTLENIANEKTRIIFKKATKTTFSALNVGILVSSATGSSSATSSIAVGMVNNKFISKRSATAIIIGSNIGTTITAQLIALESFNVSSVFGAFSIAGAILICFAKKQSIKELGKAIFYFSCLFIGLRLMNTAFSHYATDKTFLDIMRFFTANNALIFIAGVVLTAVFQGSSLMTGIIISLATFNVISTEAAMYAVLGINLGAGMPVILSSLGSDITAKQTAITNQVFNALGIIVVLPFMLMLPVADFFDKIFPTRATSIAMYHTLFNLSTSIVLIPFIDDIIKISEIILKGKTPKKNKTRIKKGPPVGSPNFKIQRFRPFSGKE